MTKIVQALKAADADRKRIAAHRAGPLGAAELDKVNGGGADWPPPPGRN
jgi:hypothetical protein